MREFSASPKKTQQSLIESGELIVTNNGVPTMLVIDIVGKDFLKLADYLRRQEALDILHKIQTASARNGLDTMPMDEIDAEIAAFRAEGRGCQ
jgi:hypothetical protein